MNIYRTETHAHTSEISICGQLGAGELVRLYHEAGFDTLIVTDHYRSDVLQMLGGRDRDCDRFWNGCRLASEAAAPLGLTVLWAMEIGFDGSWSDHLLYGITPGFLARHPRIFELDPHRFRPLAQDNGILMVQAHPFRTGVTLSDPADLDGVETWNANLSGTVNALARDWAGIHGLRMQAGSDCHAMEHVGNAGMASPRPIQSMDDYIALLRQDESAHWRRGT